MSSPAPKAKSPSPSKRLSSLVLDALRTIKALGTDKNADALPVTAEGKEVRFYRDAIIERAAEAYKQRSAAIRPFFVNLYGADGEPTTHYFVDDAAELSLEVAYEGTVMIATDGTATMLDLSDHGEVLEQERREDEADAAWHEAGVRSLETSGRV